MQLELAVGWMPMDLLVLEDAAETGAFLESCELVGMADTLEGRPG